jgi:outer membrane receptor protein involved in Fe transport
MDHRVVHETRISLSKTHGFSGVVGVYLAKVADNGILDSHDIPGIAAAGLWSTNLAWYSQNENEIRSNAIFGELYYDIDNFELTLGLRRYASRQNGLQFAAGALNGQLTDQILEQTTQHGVSPKLALSYKTAADTMIYALASKGFRAGGAGALLPSICQPFPGLNLQPNQPTSYGSDYVWNYEVGAKSELLGNRLLLTGSLFNMNWTDIQQSVTLPRCFVTFTTNAGAAHARGGELELLGHPWEALELRAGVGFDNALITDQGFSQQPVGSRVYQIPRWTWMAGGTYKRRLNLTASAFVTVALSHVGDSASGTSLIGAAGLMRPAYTILNGRLGVRWSSNEIALYANNIANERANLGDLNPISYAPVAANGNRILRVVALQPLQMGLQFRHAF